MQKRKPNDFVCSYAEQNLKFLGEFLQKLVSFQLIRHLHVDILLQLAVAEASLVNYKSCCCWLLRSVATQFFFNLNQ
jgi:hypothetical protein